MGYPYAFIGTPTVRGEQMAVGALERLRGDARHAQRDLQRLAEVWFTPISCFRTGKEEHAAPTLDALEVVLSFVQSSRDDVVRAGLGALRSAAVVCEHKAYDSLPGSIWDVPGAATALESCFSNSGAQRLGAARFVSEFPSLRLEATLRSHLSDPVYTVRWLCATALARLSQLDGLVAALVESAPRNLELNAENWPPANIFQPSGAADFWGALRELGPLAKDVLHELCLRRP
jgi:hypothetical protein